MTASRSARPTAPSDLLATAVLAAGGAFLALFTYLPLVVGLAIAVAGALVAWALRRYVGPGAGVAAGLPALVAIGALAVSAPTTAAAELAGGFAAIAFLLWLAAAPTNRPVGTLRRSLSTVALAALVLALAWSSELLLPHAPAVLGYGGLLLVAVVLVVAVLIARPELIDREPEATS